MNIIENYKKLALDLVTRTPDEIKILNNVELFTFYIDDVKKVGICIDRESNALNVYSIGYPNNFDRRLIRTDFTEEEWATLLDNAGDIQNPMLDEVLQDYDNYKAKI